MDEQTQAQFIEWLAAQLGVQTEEELQAAIEQMGDAGLEQAFAQFEQELATQSLKEGGKISYMKKLIAHRKGGKMGKSKDCPSKPNSTKGKLKEGIAKAATAVGKRKDAKQGGMKTALNRRYDAPMKSTTARAHQFGGALIPGFKGVDGTVKGQWKSLTGLTDGTAKDNLELLARLRTAAKRG